MAQRIKKQTASQQSRQIVRYTKSPLAGVWRFIVWLVGVLVFLAVGFGMTGENGIPILRIPYIPDLVTITAGWIVIILTLIGALLKIIDKANS